MRNLFWFSSAVFIGLGLLASAPAQAPYQPAVPAATAVNVNSGWPVYGGASTAAGSAMNGMANVISAAGDYNLATSAAAVNMTQAQRNAIENRQLWTNTYFQMRETNRAYRAQERGPRPTPEDVVRFAQAGRPKPLSHSQLNPDGRITWPAVLQTETFAENRNKLDALFLKRAEYGTIGFSDLMEIRDATTAMLGLLKQQINEVPPSMYVSAKDFLKSLAYEAQKAG